MSALVRRLGSEVSKGHEALRHWVQARRYIQGGSNVEMTEPNCKLFYI